MQVISYDILYSQVSHQRVSAVIPVILRMALLYKNTKIQILRGRNMSSP